MRHLQARFESWALIIRLVLPAIVGFAATPSAFATTTLVRTAFAPLVAEHSGKCLESGRVTGVPEAVGQWDCSGQPSQQWTIQRSAGAFLVINAKTRRCLSVAGDSTAVGATLIEASCNAASRLWDVSQSGNGVQLTSRNSGLCAVVRSAANLRGAALEQGSCAPDPDKRFIVNGGFVDRDTPVHLIDRLSGLCVVAPDGATSSAVVQAACDATLNTQWSLEASGTSASGNYRIVAGDTGSCLAVDVSAPGAGMQPGTRLVQTPCTGVRAQAWMPRGQPGTSSYRLQSNLSGLCLDVAAASLASGAELVETTCNVNLPSQHWALAFATPRASWGELISLPIVPVAAANLPDGRVLTWSADGEMSFGGTTRQTFTAIFDPVTGEVSQRLVSETRHDMFCPGTSNLPDGRILVNGGSTSGATSLFDASAPLSGSWARVRPMNIGRAYQANTVTSSGDVFTLGGSWAGGISNKGAELYSVASDAWTVLTEIPLPDTSDFIGPDKLGVYRGDNHMWLFAQGDGWVFHAGPSAAMHWIDTKNSGDVIGAGTRADDVYSINGNAILYDTGRILKLGGAPNYDSGLAFNRAYLIDIRDRPVVRVTRLAPMNYGRSFANSVVLPSGQVVVVGGQSRVKLFSDADAVYETELWDPKTQVFTKLNAPVAVARNYHSVALLLPDGRVLAGGGGLCRLDCPAVSHPDVQILTPPYLFNADGSLAIRPEITQAPASATAGGVITIDTDKPVVDLVLVRLSSVTHTLNTDQRYVRLSHWSSEVRNRYRATIPADRGVVLPGYWMLFAMNAKGVPSIAKTIRIQ